MQIIRDNYFIKVGDQYIYDTKEKCWNRLPQLPVEKLELKQPKQYVFRNTFLGEYLNIFQISDLTTEDLIFLYPEYQNLLEQIFKLGLYSFLHEFRQNGQNWELSATNLKQLFDLTPTQLNIMQNSSLLCRKYITHYISRLSSFYNNCKQLKPEEFEIIWKIVSNDSLTDSDLVILQTSILDSKVKLKTKLERLEQYGTPTWVLYYKCRNTVLNRIDTTLYPLFPKIEELERIQAQLDAYISSLQDEERYAYLNDLYSKFSASLSEYEFSNSTYSIIKPQIVQELDIEGNVLHHCVGTYKENIAKGDEIILFLRENNNLKAPYFTINLDTDGYIRQIHSRYNHDIADDPNAEAIYQFLLMWAQSKPHLINQKSIKLIYKPLAHL